MCISVSILITTTLPVAQPRESMDRVRNECSIGKDVDRSKCGLFANTILEGLRKAMKNLTQDSQCPV
jgi:hypothetical protein